MKNKKGTAGLYIDGANIFHGGHDAGWLLNYQKVIEWVKNVYDIKIMAYYDSIGYEKEESGKYLKDAKKQYVLNAKQVNFHKHLTGLGFRVEHKPLKFIDGDEKKPKNNMDSYLTLDVVRELSQWDTLILFSGDCDFDRLVEIVMAQGKTVQICSFNSRLSYELRTKAFTSPLVTFTELEKLESLLKNEKNGKN